MLRGHWEIFCKEAMMNLWYHKGSNLTLCEASLKGKTPSSRWEFLNPLLFTQNFAKISRCAIPKLSDSY